MIRTRVLNVLRLMERVGAIDDHGPFAERNDDRPEHRALIRRAGAEAAVLLKNDKAILPLTGTGRVALIGPNTRVAQIMGGGSAQLNPHYRVSPLDGLTAALGADRLVVAEGCDNSRFQPLIRGAFEVTYFAAPGLMGDPVHTETIDDALAFWISRVADGKVNPVRFSARLTGRYTPTQSGAFRAGLYSAGRSRMLIDGKLVVDAWTHWTRGRTFFEEGCDEVVADLTLEAGRAYDIVIEFSIEEPALLGLAAISAGIGPVLGDVALAEAVAAARSAETALVFVGRNAEWDTEGSDLVDITLPGRQNELVAAVAAVNPRTIVVLQTGGPVEMPWINAVAGVIEAWYPGQEAGNAIADVLTGAVAPSGRLPQTFPRQHRDNPAHSQDREVYPGLNGRVRYEEGVFIGYRHYDRHGVTPLFPFGFGLTYTDFALSDLALDATRFAVDGVLGVSVTLTNTGARDGADVVQIYVGDPEASVPRPEKELKAFSKVHLAAGASTRVSFSLPPRAFAFYDVTAGGWAIEPGRFIIRAARHAGDAGLEAEVTRAKGLSFSR
jgi:beta-glucosidase